MESSRTVTTEIYHTYSKLFGDSNNATKYALTPTKLLQRDLDLSSNSDTDDPNDRLLINAETTDSSDGPTMGIANSSMNISFGRSGKKRKGKYVRGRERRRSLG